MLQLSCRVLCNAAMLQCCNVRMFVAGHLGCGVSDVYGEDSCRSEVDQFEALVSERAREFDARSADGYWDTAGVACAGGAGGCNASAVSSPPRTRCVNQIPLSHVTQRTPVARFHGPPPTHDSFIPSSRRPIPPTNLT